MAITRTAKGTAQSKAANTTLQISNVALNAGDLLIVGLGYETDFALNDVQWGSRSLNIVANSGATQGDTRVRLYRARVRDTATRNIVATWAGNISARAMFATAITEASVKDVGSTATFASGTTAPNTGTAVTSTVADTISIAAFVSGGPSTDTAGTAGDGHTLGQRVGTTGGAAGTNVTIQETFEILSATGDVRASLSGATGRIWACSIAAFHARETFTVKTAVHDRWGTHGQDVRFVLEDTKGQRHQVFLDKILFDGATDQQVTDALVRRAAWVFGGASGQTLETDATRDTRIATFVNDVIKV